MIKERVGIFAGTFDPVHSGHLAFALTAMQKANLSMVYFLPERRPRYKPGVEHFGHRTAMLSRAIRPYRNFAILELPDIYFDVSRTLPKIRHEFKGKDLVFLMGSDVARNMASWKDVEVLLATTEQVVGLRGDENYQVLMDDLGNCIHISKGLSIIITEYEAISSTKIRNALRTNKHAEGLLKSVQVYAKNQWLYTDLAK